MRVIEQEAKLIGLTPSDPDAAMELIAEAGRVCYRAEAKTDAISFIDKRLKPNPPHSSILEHSDLMIEVDINNCFGSGDSCGLSLAVMSENKYVRVSAEDQLIKFQANLRTWFEVLGCEVKPWDIQENLRKRPGVRIIHNHEKPQEALRVTAKLITDRAVLAEITRHRDDVGFSVESQRYVDLAGEVEYIKPSWFKDPKINDTIKNWFEYMCCENEANYKSLRSVGLSPQHSRCVLNNQVKTVIYMTAYLTEWDWIFKLRTAPAAYPQMVELMSDLQKQFEDAGLTL